MRSLNKGQGHSFCAFDRQFGMPHTKPRTKFKVSSSSSFRDMFDRVPCQNRDRQNRDRQNRDRQKQGRQNRENPDPAGGRGV